MKQAKLLNKVEFKRLSAVINSRRYPTRNHTAVALSFYAGMRACEIAALRVGDVFESTGAVREFVLLQATQTKGSCTSTVLINRRTAQALTRYAKQYPRRLQQPEAPLIFSAKGGGFSAQTMVNLFYTLYTAAGIDGASSHSGRRQFVTELADKGLNARVVQALARHKHLNTTQRYIELNDKKLRAAVELVG
ncbi:site-specific integrase [uncultured Roseovarius sp.]|uniref:tyrosine-type recombinase/integrase n=1 Tax=uncultured Roseovarius sp. TaxID=293344 RepID=UPI0025F202AF|nr:site-specific integrase [uncultured Roseovarius sp.]